ncbi:MAG: non-ribosomal peptide synthetase [Chloroflexi bacterium]|nr:non-ribosomal peptide synthetase [Chloroflexota bacterium]
MAQAEQIEARDSPSSDRASVGAADNRRARVPTGPCVHDLIRDHAERTPDAIAIQAPGRAPLTFSRLYRHMTETLRTLNGLGFGRGDRVAMVLPDGPDMAVCFLAVASGMAAAPLNPDYTASEFDSYLADLRVTALIVQSGIESEAPNVARARGIAVVELSPAFGAEAGLFALAGNRRSPAALGGFSELDDVALVLQTSGSTGRPKIVALTHANICASIAGSLAAFKMVPDDRCVCLLPLFHVGGLVGTCLTALGAGSSVICTPGFSAHQFFRWLADFQPTVFHASPTMLQAILAQAPAHRAVISRHPLRLIRSGAASLTPHVLTELERVFDVPVIDSYGMTETATRITTNPLPPGKRKPGSVGVAAGPEVGIMDEAGRFLAPGQIGEIVVRGANVIQAYENNPAANASAFVDGWLHTGDQGYLDVEGYLFITGRLKEIINRGGAKVSPREVDDVILAHPAVAEAVTFAVPHRTLGEDVATAVVLRENGTVTGEAIREFATRRLAGFKVPRRIIIVDRIPKGPTGKVQRIGLAEKLGIPASDRRTADMDLRAAAPPTVVRALENQALPAAAGVSAEVPPGRVAPRDTLERLLAKCWETALGVRPIGVRDDFFDLGGDSLLAMHLFALIGTLLGRSIPPTTLLHAATVEQLAGFLRREGWSPPWPSLVPIQPGGSKPPFFWVHALGRHVLCYRNLARYLGPDQPLYALQARGLDGTRPPFTRVEEMAAAYLAEIRSVEPAGPYYLGGLSFGGKVAYEMAQQLRAQGERVALLALFDPYGPGYAAAVRDASWLGSAIYRGRQSIDFHRGTLAILGPKERPSHVREWAGSAVRRIRSLDSRSGQAIRRALPRAVQDVQAAIARASDEYVPRPYPGRVTIFRARRQPPGCTADPTMGWGTLAAEVDVHVIPGYHASIIVEPHVRTLARHLERCLRATQGIDNFDSSC